MNNELVSSHEEWRIIPETNNRYSISSEGRVKNNETGICLRAIKMPKGYVKVNLHTGNKRYSKQIHRLVATMFIPNPENKSQVNHKNGIKDDNRVENLEWVTQEENLKHAYDTGLVRHKDDRYDGYLHRLWKRIHRENMCDEWQDYLVFYEWCYINGYQDGKYISAIDNSRPYSPNNCVIGNDIIHPSKKYILFGDKLNYKDISQKYGLTEGCIKYRIKNGMSLEDAVMTPKGKSKDNSLRIRLGENLYKHVFEESSKKKITVSAYVRDLIDKDIREKAKSEKF